jgi:hypothetical protein
VRNSSFFVAHHNENGWLVRSEKGPVLRMQHERIFFFESGDATGLFQLFEISLPPGNYTVEVAILSEGNIHDGFVTARSSFPFVITRKYVEDVSPDRATEVKVAIPDDWTQGGIGAVAEPQICGGTSPPDIDQLRHFITAYMDDPVVKALRGVDPSLLAEPDGVVALNLPLAQGGMREFDGVQVGYIAEAVRSRHYMIGTHEQVASCLKHFPQFSDAYAEYDKMITFMDNDLAAYSKLAKLAPN